MIAGPHFISLDKISNSLIFHYLQFLSERMPKATEPFIAAKWFYLSEWAQLSGGSSPMNSSWSEGFSEERNKSPRELNRAEPHGQREIHIIHKAGDANKT